MPPVPPSEPPAPPGRRVGRWAWVAGLAAFGLLAVGAVVLWDRDDGGGEGDKPGAEPTVTRTPLPKGAMGQRWRTSAFALDKKPEPQASVDLWAGKSVITHITAQGVRGYDIASGKQKWVVKAPRPDLKPCAASPRPNGSGIGAVMYGAAGNCLVVAAIDADTGEVLWSKDLAGRGRSLGAVEVTVGDKALTVGLDWSEPVIRFSPSDGKELAALKQPGGDRCMESTVAHTAVSTVSFSECFGGGAARRLTLYDTETGRLRWSTPLKSPGGMTVSKLVADEPLTLFDIGSSSLRTYSSRGELKHTIPMKDSGQSGSAITLHNSYLVSESVLVTKVFAHDAPVGKATYVAYDLKTGKRLWRRLLPTRTELIGVERDHALVLAPRKTALQYDLSRVGIRDGKVGREGVVVIPSDPRPEHRLDEATPYALAWDERRLYVATRLEGAEPEGRVIAYRRNP